MKQARIIWLLTLALLAGLRPAVAQSWMNTTAPRFKGYSIASSADGTKLVVVGSYAVLTSRNSGATWVYNTNNIGAWNSVASSADGTKLVAAGYNTNGICLSTDSGQTWTLTSAPLLSWRAVACSADGNIIIAAAGYSSAGPIFTSTNSGATWISNSLPLRYWYTVASSSDGSKLVAAASGPGSFAGGPVYTSTNSGGVWISNSLPQKPWTSVASSSDGLKLVMLGGFSGFYTSTNGGNAWVSNGMVQPWIYVAYVASSADGSKLVAVRDGYTTTGPIYTSTNSGSSWISNNTPVTNWTAVASSADGSKLAATLYARGVYTAPPEVFMGSSNYSNGLVLSWPSFATNFGLQTNLDLSAANWSNAGLPVNDDGTNKSVTLPAPTGNLFFRLIGN